MLPTSRLMNTLTKNTMVIHVKQNVKKKHLKNVQISWFLTKEPTNIVQLLNKDVRCRFQIQLVVVNT